MGQDAPSRHGVGALVVPPRECPTEGGKLLAWAECSTLFAFRPSKISPPKSGSRAAVGPSRPTAQAAHVQGLELSTEDPSAVSTEP